MVLFTWDGEQLSGHHDSALAAIKKLDRHATVSQMLRLWQHLLVDDLSLHGIDHATPFTVGDLVEVIAPRSIVDKGWLRLDVADADPTADDQQQSLFNFEDP